MHRETIVAALTLLAIAPSSAYILTPALDRLHPYAVGETPSTIEFFLATTPSNIIFDYLFIGNTVAQQTFPTKTGADAPIALDPSRNVSIRWIVQSHTAVVMTYKFTLKTENTTLGSATRSVLFVPELPQAVSVAFPPASAAIPAGAKVSLKVERTTLNVAGWQPFFVSERLHQSYVELPVA